MKQVLILWFVLTAITQAGLKFESLLLEVHAPADAETVTADFKFANQSGRPVSITKSDSGCSCLSVQISDGKLLYAPQEKGLVRATFAMGNFSGTVDKVIAIWLDQDPADQPSVKLTVRIHIPVLVALEPKTLRWSTGGDTGPQTLRVTMAQGEMIRILNVTSSSETFGVETTTVEEGKIYDLIVTPSATDAPVLGILRIETDGKLPKHRMQQAFAVISKQPPAEAAIRQ
ncbi:MAG: DUF1573 domain-containing protein [Akkermansiaceae bacterium]